MLYLLHACTPEVELTLFQNQLMVSLCVYAISVCVCRRVVVQVCRIVEELYAQYIAKAASEWIPHLYNWSHSQGCDLQCPSKGQCVCCVQNDPVHLLPELCRDGVFSLAANLSRLRAQLTLQANRRCRNPNQMYTY